MNNAITAAARAVGLIDPPTKSGSERIAEALSKFEVLADELDQAAADNHAQVATNHLEIERLQNENNELVRMAGRGATVAKNLREFVAG